MGEFVFDVPTEEEVEAEMAAEEAEERLQQAMAADVESGEAAEEEPRSPDSLDWLEEDDTEYMADVDQRLEVATYFRTLLRQSLFSDASSAARIVERKVRVFVKEQLEILLSLRPEAAPAAVVVPQFDEAEVAALKMVAARLIKKPDLAPPAPTVKPVAVPPAPRVPTVVPAVVTRRPAAPLAAVPAAPAVRSAAPAPSQAVKPTRGRPRGPAKPAAGPKLEEVRLIAHPDDPSVMVETRHKRIQRPAGAIPFPSEGAMEAAIAATAHRSAGSIAKSNPGHSDLARVIISQS